MASRKRNASTGPGQKQREAPRIISLATCLVLLFQNACKTARPVATIFVCNLSIRTYCSKCCSCLVEQSGSQRPLNVFKSLFGSPFTCNVYSFSCTGKKTLYFLCLHRNIQFIAPSLPFSGDQAVDAHAARAPPPPPTQGGPGGGSGLSYHVFRGAMTGRCLASGRVRLRRQGTGREGRERGGRTSGEGGEEKRR